MEFVLLSREETNRVATEEGCEVNYFLDERNSMQLERMQERGGENCSSDILEKVRG